MRSENGPGMETDIPDFDSLYNEIWEHRTFVQTITTSYVDREDEEIEVVVGLEFGVSRILIDRHLHTYAVSKMAIRNRKAFIYGRRLKGENRIAYSERCLMDGDVPAEKDEGLPGWPRNTP